MKAKQSKFKAGMYLLETLTAGMYNEPLSIYREYIQNSIDSFDIIKKAGRRGPQLVKIDLNPAGKSISVSDNGAGIPHVEAEKVLSSIGSSDKRIEELRGFRGIGRLGGIAFCDKAIFRTKALGEKVESIQEWDCKKLRLLLADTSQREMTLKDLFDQTTYFHKNNGLQEANSYFKVDLFNVSSFRNHILDIRKIEKYLQSVAPIPFDHENFDFASDIQTYLKKNVPNYGELSIKINGEKIFKPYRSDVKTTNKRNDPIKGIEYFTIDDDNETIAYGWQAERSDLIGAITPSEGVSGIRVRAGNIAIGDNRLLDNCFRETRFNSYAIGEIHVTSPSLIPNSRRDDFVDNKTKTLFYNDIERKIGLPLSKEIRLKSRLNSQNGPSNDIELKANTNIETNSKLTNKSAPAGGLNKPQLKIDPKIAGEIIAKILNDCKNCNKLKNILSSYGL